MTKRKRVKFGEAAKEELTKVDLAPKMDNFGSDTPKKFMTILNRKKFIKEKAKNKNEEKVENNDKQKSAISELKIQPHESLRDFSRRVNDTTNKQLEDQNKKLSSKALKRKKLKQEHKEIVEELMKDEKQIKDFKRENVKFGDTAQEPPKLVVPKQKFKVKNPNQSAADKRIMEAERLRVVEAYRKMKARKS